MTATLIVASGNGYPIGPEGVENMLRAYRVTGARTNGSQTRFTLDGTHPCAIVANCHSEAHAILQAAYEHECRPATKSASERALDRQLELGMKSHLTRAEQAEYDELVAARDAYLRATGATRRAVEAATTR